MSRTTRGRGVHSEQASERLAAEIAGRLLGRSLMTVERGEYDWTFRFTESAFVHVECAWRILLDDSIAFGGGDHGQKFGLPAPLDGPTESHRWLRGKQIQGVRIRADTADLSIDFSGRAALEILNTSSGYEGWQFRDTASE
jgi:hypothetical protein